MDKYAGFLYCGECGSRLYLHRAKTLDPKNNNFMCSGYQSRKSDCTSHYIRESALDEIVLTSLKKVTGWITPKRYDSLASGYEQDQLQLKSKLIELESQIDIVKLKENCIWNFIEKARQYVEIPVLTPELIKVFIRRIEVFEKEKKYSRTCGNRIVIYFTFQSDNGMEIDKS